MKALFSRFLMLLMLLAAASAHAQVNHPPQNFYVDPLTLHASWNAPDTSLSRDRTTELLDYYVFMDDSLVGITTGTEYDYDSLGLVYGTLHTAGVAAHYTTGMSDTVVNDFTSVYLIPISDLTAECSNGTLILSWAAPQLSDVASSARFPDWEFQFSFPDAYGPSEAGSETDGTYIYHSVTDNNHISYYTLDGTYYGYFQVTGISGLYELAYDPYAGYFYGCDGSTTVYKMDFNTQEVVGQFTAPIALRTLAYDVIQDGFWGNNWSSNIVLFDKEGIQLFQFPLGDYGNFGGLAVDAYSQWGPYLWAFSRDSTGNLLVQYEIATGQPTGYVYDVDSLSISNGQAGGLYIWPDLIEGTVTLGGNIQGDIAFGYKVDDSPTLPGSDLLGYNIYKDGDYFDWVSNLLYDTVYATYDYTWPFLSVFTVTAVYDLTPYGFPGEQGESMECGPAIADCAMGWELPFFEDWSSGSFDENEWATDGQNWEINVEQGQEPPCASFSWEPVIMNYAMGLESYFINATDTTEGSIFIDFDLKLQSNDTSGTEKMLLQVWNWESQTYYTVRAFDNDTGSFDWQRFHVNIGNLALDMVFKVRFLAIGSNTSHIQAWYIDNIEIYRSCLPPRNVQVAENFQIFCLDVTWDPPEGILEEQWIHWDDGVNYISIGTDDSIEFDVAARWTPSQLTEFENGVLTKVAFFPAEAEAEYRIRVWTGAGPANMIIDQPVTNPAIGTYDTIPLDAPFPLDISQELWVGYYINTPTGYPAGCDDGPAIDGYGNMMNYDGGWQTLLQINPDLDYNWNIMAYIARDGKELALSNDILQNKTNTSYLGRNRELVHYEIHRSVDMGPYALYDVSEHEYYQDYDVYGHSAYCYKVKAVYEGESDSCISSFSNEFCHIIPNIHDLKNLSGIKCYPNPANDYITIKSPEDIKKVTLYSMMGEILITRESEAREYRLDVSGLPSGVYYLNISISGEDLCRKVVVMH